MTLEQINHIGQTIGMVAILGSLAAVIWRNHKRGTDPYGSPSERAASSGAGGHAGEGGIQLASVSRNARRAPVVEVASHSGQ